MLSRQGKRGQRGECGPKGDQGPPAEWPQLISSEIDENYNLTILRSNNSLEIIPLRPAFERFFLGNKSMTMLRRTDDPNICYVEADPVLLWTCGITEFKVDTRNSKFILTAIMRDRSEGPVADVTDLFEKFKREQGR